MNFDFEINLIVPHEITVYNSDLKIIASSSNGSTDDKVLHQKYNIECFRKICHIINQIGEASSKSQGLKDIITSYKKLSINESHKIYLMKDEHSNNGKGSLIGLIKVGVKKLFVFDNRGRQREVMPLCLLDFYIYDSQQRKGYGRKLFDFMLQTEQIDPTCLAVDSPSEKCLRFLAKNFNLKNRLNQVNNFVVFDGFFDTNYHISKFDKFTGARSANPYSEYHLPKMSTDFFRAGQYDIRQNAENGKFQMPRSANPLLYNDIFHRNNYSNDHTYNHHHLSKTSSGHFFSQNRANEITNPSAANNFSVSNNTLSHNSKMNSFAGLNTNFDRYPTSSAAPGDKSNIGFQSGLTRNETLERTATLNRDLVPMASELKANPYANRIKISKLW